MNNKYSIQEGLESLDRIRLMMGYDLSKSLNENKILLEQLTSDTKSASAKTQEKLKELPNWYKNSPTNDTKDDDEGFGTAAMDILKGTTSPTGVYNVANRRAQRLIDYTKKDEEKMGASRMSDEEREKYYFSPKMPNGEYILIPKIWEKTYTNIVLWKDSDNPYTAYGFNKWENTEWGEYIPDTKILRSLGPVGTLKNFYIGSKSDRKLFKGSLNWDDKSKKWVFMGFYDKETNEPYDWKNWIIDPYGKNPFPMKVPQAWWEDTHTILAIIQFATYFIPLVGPWVSGGIGLINAGLYHEEGDNYMAGMELMFSLMPGAEELVLKIPAIKQLGEKGMGLFGRKIAQKVPEGTKELSKDMLQGLSETEMEVINGLSKMEKETVEQSLDKSLKKTIEKNTPTIEKNLSKNPKTKNILINAGKDGLKFTKNLVVGATPYLAAGVAYSKAYDKMQSGTIKSKVDSENLNWEEVKKSFKSSGSEEDNKKLENAWNEGWRPGGVVPEKYRTEEYNQVFKQEQQDIQNLNKLRQGN